MASLEESTFLLNFKNITLFILWKLVSQDQLLSTEPFSDLWKDSLPFCVNKLEANGTSGFHQDRFNSFQSVRKLNNSLIKFITLWFSKITVLILTTLEINWLKRSEMLNLKVTTLSVLLVQNNAKIIKLT